MSTIASPRGMEAMEGQAPRIPACTVEVVLLSQPALMDFGPGSTPYMVFEIHLLSERDQTAHPEADRAVMYLKRDGSQAAPEPELQAGFSYTLEGAWSPQSEKVFLMESATPL